MWEIKTNSLMLLVFFVFVFFVCTCSVILPCAGKGSRRRKELGTIVLNVLGWVTISRELLGDLLDCTQNQKM